MFYQKVIKKILAQSGYVGKYDSRHIEGWMRCESGTLDALTPRKFASEVEASRMCIDSAGVETSEKIAVSHGL